MDSSDEEMVVRVAIALNVLDNKSRKINKPGEIKSVKGL